jgi:hypothetical protein
MLVVKGKSSQTRYENPMAAQEHQMHTLPTITHKAGKKL